MFIVVAYDIPDDKRRTRLYKTLLGFGEPVQYSVFECILSDVQFEKLRQAVARVIEPEEDHVRYYELCQACNRRIRTVGKVPVTGKPSLYVI
jgi:CRISPR-associated protein Cas2